MMLRFHAWFVVGLSAVLLTTTQAQPALSTNAPPPDDTTLTNLPHVPGIQYTNSIGMQLLKLPGGFWAGKFEVTQKEYQKITGSNPSTFPGEQNPVDNVS